ncbi:MAG TPA: phosphodiester glycosidase family protein [Bacteroidales bacterium]|nr:phosphodiester glycosidase family protein [Bacteroidales bacterium]
MHPQFRTCFLATLLLLNGAAAAQPWNAVRIRWHRERIAPGLFWRYSHTFLEDSVPQNINILVINPGKRKISLVYNPGKNLPVSVMASPCGALAAVNAGFFSIRDGGSLTYIMTGGKISDRDTASMWHRVENMSGLLVIGNDGNPVILKERTNGWIDSCSACRDALITGPLLLENGRIAVLPNTSLSVARHPRTAIGIRKDKRIILVTVDGRSDRSAGLTIPLLAGLMLSLKCVDAVNLDGGGSTTMWIRGKPFYGVVNIPCDNKKFDHSGERPVADILMVK